MALNVSQNLTTKSWLWPRQIMKQSQTTVILKPCQWKKKPINRASLDMGTSDIITESSKKTSRVHIQTLPSCKLGIARYPNFSYNANGGGGPGTAVERNGGTLDVEFDVEQLYIPSVDGKTTRFLGLPLPPFICIKIVPQTLKGSIHHDSGKVELEFVASFFFSVGSLYRAPPLIVDTILTTETSQGQLRKGVGKRIDANGDCELVGVAPLSRINDAFMNTFLTLPTECLALMAANFKFDKP